MKALILNSGMGNRMLPLTKDQPKCMSPIGGGYTILSRQLTQLASLGVRDIVVTTGPFAELLKSHAAGLGLPVRITYAPNPLYRETNYIYSMHAAAEHLHSDILLLHGDLVLETGVLASLMKSERSSVAVDSSLPLPDKDFKARLENGRVAAIGVEFFGPGCVASQPAYFWKAADFNAWMAAIAGFVAEGQMKVYAENAFNAQNGRIPLYPLELCGRLCAEIDNEQDLRTVSARFLDLLDKGGDV